MLSFPVVSQLHIFQMIDLQPGRAIVVFLTQRYEHIPFRSALVDAWTLDEINVTRFGVAKLLVSATLLIF